MVKAVTERSKVVVKNLPPLLPQEAFLTAIEPFCKGKYTGLRYVPGRQSAKGVRPSRAYLYMNDPLLVYDFRADFDGHSFVNERGQQYQCLVEYAPYQKAPKVVTKKDPREGTLEKDTGYQEFLERLEKDPFALPGKPPQAEEIGASQHEASTVSGKKVSALMLYLQKKWAGTLEPSADGQKALGRQRRKGRKAEERARKSEEDRKPTAAKLAPPPGFSSITPTQAPIASAKLKQQKKPGEPKDSKAKEVLQPPQAAEVLAVPKKRREKPLKGRQPEASQGRAIAAVAPDSGRESNNQDQGRKADAPKRILKKETGPAQTAVEPVPKDQDPRRQQAKTKEGGESQRRQSSKPVRAGFQPYTPKSRSGGQS